MKPKTLSGSKRILCDKLISDGFLERQYLEVEANCTAFPKPKTVEKCSFILNMRNIIEQ